jgi:glycosyltransferase involved in cell wall biosynthesis
VTLVNPQPHKGVFVFVRIAAELGRRRPDIPLLVVEGRAKADWLNRTGLDLSGLTNLHVMANTPDPRDFLGVSRLVLMPSLWSESFARVAAEALINGIPVLASRRGGLPETLEQAGFLFDVPECYTPESRVVPTAEEVAPWLETIIQLWDDPVRYERERQRCWVAAQAWRPEALGPRFEEFFGRCLRAGHGITGT